MTEGFLTRRAIMVLFTRRYSNVIRVMIDVFVALQQLLLAKSLLTEVAIERLLVGMNQHVRLQVPSRDRSVSAEFAAVTFFAFMRFCMNLIAVAIWEFAVTAFALDRNVARVQFLDMNAQIGFSSTRCGTQLTLENRLFSHRVDHFMCLQRIRLREPGVANVAWIIELH